MIGYNSIPAAGADLRGYVGYRYLDLAALKRNGYEAVGEFSLSANEAYHNALNESTTETRRQRRKNLAGDPAYSCRLQCGLHLRLLKFFVHLSNSGM